MPSTKRQTAFRLPIELSDAMQKVKERDGMPQAEQVRRALRDWLAGRGVLLPVAYPDSEGRRTRDIDASGKPVRRVKKGQRR